MPTINTITPSPANPGQLLTITGTGFVAGAVVSFVSGPLNVAADTSFVDAQHLACSAPDLGGDAQTVAVTVTNPDESEASGSFALAAWPPVEEAYPLIGLAALKRQLGIAAEETDADAHLRELILTASAQLAGAIKRPIAPTEYSAEVDGSGGSMLELPQTPILSVSALSIDGVAVDIDTVHVYPDYIAFDESDGEYQPRLRASGQIFPSGRQNVSVTWLAGFEVVPADLARACAFQVEHLQNVKPGLLSEQSSQAGNTTQFSQNPISPLAQVTVNRYRRKGLAIA